MATVSTKGSGTWQALLRVWVAGEGYKRAWRTTGVPSSAPKAQAVSVAEALQKGAAAAYPANAGKADQRTFALIMEQIWKAAGLEPPELSLTWSEYWPKFVDSCRAGEKSLAIYRARCREFELFLGTRRGKLRLGQLTADDFQGMCDTLLATGRSQNTAKQYLDVYWRAMDRAVLLGLCGRNVARLAAVSGPREEKEDRQPFSPEELGRISAAITDPEWRTAFLLGFWCGMRLRDATGRRWSDFTADTVKFLPEKKRLKGKWVTLPLAAPLKAHLASLRRDGEMVTPVLHSRGNKVSKDFIRLIEAAGIDTGAQEGGTKFSKLKRAKSFHSLRHTLVTELAKTGAEKQVRQLIADHDDGKISDRYTHAVVERLAEALAKVGAG